VDLVFAGGTPNQRDCNRFSHPITGTRNELGNRQPVAAQLAAVPGFHHELYAEWVEYPEDVPAGITHSAKQWVPALRVTMGAGATPTASTSNESPAVTTSLSS